MDAEFLANEAGLHRAVDLLCADHPKSAALAVPARLPETGLGAAAVLDLLAPAVLGGATRLGGPTSFAHMDPPTPWITWATTLWNAAMNQNLLHPATAPVARQIEERVVAWLAPCFGMSGGHMTPGSTVANLVALWAARERVGVIEVAASDAAHLSIAKAAHILGLKFRPLPLDSGGALCRDALPDDLSRTALVLTAGTTSAGTIDPLDLAGRAAWTHVDAAWAGPLRLTRYADRLAGIDRADSVAVSMHKWFFQPKESALVLFKDNAKASAAISFGGAYLTVPNIGVLGSHGAAAVPLLATLLAWGRQGLADRIERCVDRADELAQFVRVDARLALFREPESAIVVWRPNDTEAFDSIWQRLPPESTSVTNLAGERWFRNVAANPNVDVLVLLDAVRNAMKAA